MQNKARTGRRGKGERHLVASRLPVAIAEIAFKEADARDMSMSEFLAAVLGERYELTEDAPMRRRIEEKDSLPLPN